MKDELYRQYKGDADFKKYVDRYCAKHNKNILEAFEDQMIEEAANNIKNQKKDIIGSKNEQI